MKTVFVGDIHGKAEQVKRALDRDGTIIFVGDFIDSYDRTIMEHDECYRLLFDAIQKKKARAIWGNHELSYLPVCGEMGQSIHRCSGYEYPRSILMRKYESQIREHFEPYIILNEEVLVSHAGLTNPLWQTFKLTKKNLRKKLDSWWPNRKSPMHFIGRYRGGRDLYGGLFWCDWIQEFIPVPGLIQIFGHTAGRGIRQIEQSFCIDCLDNTPDFLEMEI